MASAGKIALVDTDSSAPPELELLLAAARQGASGVRAQMLETATLRWDEVLRLAELHGLEPFVAKTLRGASANVPAPVWQSLNRACAEIAGRNLALGKELIRVSTFFQKAKIDHLVFKGPLLAQALYETVALRVSRDIDLLVRPEQTDRAFAALKELGYADKDDLDDRQRAASIRFSSEQCFAKDKIEVDLHWRLVPRTLWRTLNVEGLWRRAAAVKLFESFLPTLGAEDNFVALCLHAGEHAWSQISLLSDLARLLSLSPEFDWEIVRRQSRDANVRRAVDVTALLLVKYFDARIPDDFLRREMQVELLAAQIVTEFWPEPEKSPHRETDLEWIRQRCKGLRYGDRMRWMGAVFLSPTLADFKAIRLPRFLQGLYPVVRLVRLVFR